MNPRIRMLLILSLSLNLLFSVQLLKERQAPPACPSATATAPDAEVTTESPGASFADEK